MARAGLELRVGTRDLERMSRTFKLWATDQLPFATAAALTDTARAARAHVADGLVEHFRLRNQGLRNAIAYEPADKRDRPIRALVGVRPWAGFLVLHAVGGVKRARGGHRVAVPARAVRRTGSGRVRKRDQPRELRSGKGLIVPMLDKRIAVRRRGGVVVYYTLVSSAKIEARWPFVQEVEATVAARLDEFFAKRARQALTFAP